MLNRFTRFNRRRKRQLPRIENLEARCLLTVPAPVSQLPEYIETFELFQDEQLTMPGLEGSFVNQSLRSFDEPDWRASQNISGTRIDTSINFVTSTWGNLSDVGVTGGTADNPDLFSVQWDGYVNVLQDNTKLWLAADDGARLWIDLNSDGQFDSTGDELIDNGWGSGHAAKLSNPGVPIQRGSYQIRIQYEEGNGDNVLRLRSGPQRQVRIAYLIPTDREPRQEVYDNLKFAMTTFQEWMRRQMQSHGFGQMTFHYEQDTDGSPRVNVLRVNNDAAWLRGDDHETEGPYSRSRDSLRAAGAALFSAGETWLIVHEAHRMNADGTTDGEVALGAGSGRNDIGGIAVMDSIGLTFSSEAGLHDERVYDQQIVPGVGPFPMVDEVTFRWFEGDTFGSLGSVAIGVLMHELGHAFGVPHDFQNDRNAFGNLMGNGLRGLRGSLFPDLYPNEATWLSRASAIALSSNRFLQPEQTFPDAATPVITYVGAPQIEDGLMEVTVDLSSESELASAVIRIDGEVTGSVQLSGNNVRHTFRTSRFDILEEQVIRVYARTVTGHVANEEFVFPAAAIAQQGPRAFVELNPRTIVRGQSVTLDASRSTDDDDSLSELVFEWDTDGDGVFDTPPGSLPTLNLTPSEVGSTLITVRVTDTGGAQHVSGAVVLTVKTDLPGDVDGNGVFDPNDSSLIQMIGLAATDEQIDASKGNSPYTVLQVRESMEGLTASGDVDGDQDFDANDAFLLHLIKLSGTDAQIDASKGTSLLSASQIRERVNSLGMPPTQQTSVAPQALPLIAAAQHELFDAEAHAAIVVTRPAELVTESPTAMTDVSYRAWLSDLAIN